MPRSLEEWKPRIQAIATKLIEEIGDRKETDILQDLANQLPVIVIADLLGIPSRDRKQIKRWSDILFIPHHKEKR